MNAPQHLPPEALDEWTRAVCDDLGLDADDIDIALILDLARDVAHGVARPAAPLTAFLVGLAAAQSDDPDAASDAADRVTELAKGWEA